MKNIIKLLHKVFSRQYELELEEVIKHIYIHSSYKNCGYEQMTKRQKLIFDNVIKKTN